MTSIYELIKIDSTFPYVNVGKKKKYLVNVEKYETWLNDRTNAQKKDHFRIPSTADLMNLFKDNGA